MDDHVDWSDHLVPAWALSVTLRDMTSPDPQQPAAPPPPQYAPPPGYGPPFAPQPYPYPGPYQKPRVPGRPPRKPMSQGKIAIITVSCCLAGLALFLAAGAMMSRLTPGTGGAGYDAQMVACHAGGGQYDIVGAQADVSVVNKTDRPHSYTITVAFTDSSQSTQYATGTATISDLQPGQTGQATATSWQGGNSSVQGCKILRVTQSVF